MQPHHLCFTQALDSHLSRQPSASLPHSSSVTKSYEFYFLKMLQTVPDSLSMTSAPGHNFIQFTWSPCLQTHPLKSPPCPITYPSLKCSGTSSYLNVQASNHDSRASWSGPGPSLWLISLTALCFLATLGCYTSTKWCFSGPYLGSCDSLYLWCLPPLYLTQIQWHVLQEDWPDLPLSQSGLDLLSLRDFVFYAADHYTCYRIL